VLEVAKISVRPDRTSAFEEAFADAHHYVENAEGYIASQLSRTVGVDNQYVFLVWWRSLADHVETFVASMDFTKFDALVGPHFEIPPVVTHFQEVEVPG